MHQPHARIVAGIFAGGRSSRMGGRPKGLLEVTPGVTLIRRWKELFDGAGIPCILVGAGAEYAGEGIPALADGDARGPLGGLLALLAHAGEGVAIAVACDMPFVSPALVRRLADAPPAAAVAARRGSYWEPFFARYDAAVVLPVALAQAQANRTSLQSLLAALPAQELQLSDAEAKELDDWDTPEDAARSRRDT